MSPCRNRAYASRCLFVVLMLQAIVCVVCLVDGLSLQKYELNLRNSLLLGEYFRVMEQLGSTLSSVIDSTLGLKCRSFGYQITSTTYGYDTAYCLKSHCEVRGCCKQKWVFLTQFILKFSNERTSTRKKDVEGLSCGFEDILIHNDVSIKLKTRGKAYIIKKN